MTRILLLACLALLSGCSSFKLGSMLYCPYGAACSFQTVSQPVQPEAAAPPAPAASA